MTTHDGHIKTETELRDEILRLTGMIDSYFSKGGTTHKEKIQWIRKQIEFKGKDNCYLRNKIDEELNDLRNGRRHVRALKIILRRHE